MKVRLFVFVCLISAALFSLRGVDAASCPLERGKAYVGGYHPAVYYISSDCKKRPMKNPDIFFSYFTDWNEVRRVAPAKLQEVPDHELGFLPWGPRRNFENGSLIKTTDDPRVYLKIDGEIHPIGSADAFKGVGFQWTWVEDVAPEVMAKYTKKRIITKIDDYPERLAFKYAGSPDVYLLEEENAQKRKRHIKTLNEFKQMGYRKDRIATFPIGVQFSSGDGVSAPTAPVKSEKKADGVKQAPLSARRGSSASPQPTQSTRIAPQGSEQAGREVSDCVNYAISKDGAYEVCIGKAVTDSRSGKKIMLESATSKVAVLKVGSSKIEIAKGKTKSIPGTDMSIRFENRRMVEQLEGGSLFFALDTVVELVIDSSGSVEQSPQLEEEEKGEVVSCKTRRITKDGTYEVCLGDIVHHEATGVQWNFSRVGPYEGRENRTVHFLETTPENVSRDAMTVRDLPFRRKPGDLQYRGSKGYILTYAGTRMVGDTRLVKVKIETFTEEPDALLTGCRDLQINEADGEYEVCIGDTVELMKTGVTIVFEDVEASGGTESVFVRETFGDDHEEEYRSSLNWGRNRYPSNWGEEGVGYTMVFLRSRVDDGNTYIQFRLMDK